MYQNEWLNQARAELLEHIDSYRGKLEVQLDDIVSEDPEMERLIKLACSVPGIGRISAMILLSETNGFRNIPNSKALVSYAGLDVVDYQSGTIQRRGHISKRGNVHIRTALYLCTLGATIHKAGSVFREFRDRILANNGGNKMKAKIALMRKILVVVYGVVKSGKPFDPEYHKPKKNTSGDEEMETSHLLMQKYPKFSNNALAY